MKKINEFSKYKKDRKFKLIANKFNSYSSLKKIYLQLYLVRQANNSIPSRHDYNARINLDCKT